MTKVFFLFLQALVIKHWDENHFKEEDKSTKAIKTELECNSCSFTCNKISSLIRHKKLLHSTILCRFCPMEMWTELEHKRHMRKRHGSLDGPNRFTCTQCNYSSPLRANLERHITGFHMKIKLRCPFCRQGFSDKRALVSML